MTPAGRSLSSLITETAPFGRHAWDRSSARASHRQSRVHRQTSGSGGTGCGNEIIGWLRRSERRVAMPDNDAPVRDTLAVMTAASLENSNLPPREFMIVRLAALAAVDASATSYALNVEAATEAGLTLDDVQDVLVAVAPIIGTTRVVSAAANIAEGLGLVIALAEAELEAELEAEEDEGA